MNAYNITPAQVLIEQDGEPELGSIVIDSCGVSYQKRRLDGVELWFEAGYNKGVDWQSVNVFGPLALVAVTFGEPAPGGEWWEELGV